MTLGSIIDFDVILDQSDNARITFRDVKSALALTYIIERSDDQTYSWSTVASFSNVKSNPEWDTILQRWLVVDTDGDKGDVYRLTVTDGVSTVRSFAVLAPSAPLCTVVGYLYTMGGKPLRAENRAVDLSYVQLSPLQRLPGAIGPGDNVGLSKEIMRVRANGDGVWTAQIWQGSMCRIRIPAINFNRVCHIPSVEGPVNVTDLTVLPEPQR